MLVSSRVHVSRRSMAGARAASESRAFAAPLSASEQIHTYLSLQVADEELVQRLASLVAVADVLKCFGRVLAGDIQQDLLTTSAAQWLA